MDCIITTAVKKILKRMCLPGFLTQGNWPLRIRRDIWLLCGMVCLAAGPATATSAEIDEMIIDTSRDYLLLSAAIHDIITGEVNAVPEANVSATIIFSIALYEVKPLWFNKKIAHHTAINSIKRNSEQNAYRLLRSWDSGPPLKMTTLHQARLQMAEINNLKVMPLAGLEKGRTYQIRVRAVCQDKNAFMFSPAECFKTDWHTVDFTL